MTMTEILGPKKIAKKEKCAVKKSENCFKKLNNVFQITKNLNQIIFKIYFTAKKF